MKKYLLSISFLALAGLLHAQKPITFSDDTLSFGNFELPGIWVSIPETSAEVIQNNWTKAIQRGTKSKPVTNGQNISLFGAQIRELFVGPVNIESTIKGQDTVVMLFAGVEFRRGEFAKTGTNEYDKLKSYLKEFAKSEYIKVVEKQLSDEESKLKAMEKDLSSARKNKEKLERGIQSTRSRIARDNDNKNTYRKQLEVNDMNIDNASSALSYMSEPEAKKTKESELKKAQKVKKGLMKKIASTENKISKANNRIADANNNIALNQKNQDEMGVRINSQKMVVSEFQNKLKQIKAY